MQNAYKCVVGASKETDIFEHIAVAVELNTGRP